MRVISWYIKVDNSAKVRNNLLLRAIFTAGILILKMALKFLKIFKILEPVSQTLEVESRIVEGVPLEFLR